VSRKRRHHSTVAVFALVAAAPLVAGRAEAADPPRPLAAPVEDGPFIRPAAGAAAEPLWGIQGGIAVGLWPKGGPRGLIRVYTPYLGQGRRRVMNFVAVEPVARGARGLSELEASALDRVDGKAMWTGDTFEDDPKPRPPWHPARGVVGSAGGHKTLTVYLYVEPFDNGARPVVEVQLREDRPHEVAFRVDSARRGAPMQACVLTATMGNYARIRRLWLKDRVVDAHALYRSARFDPRDGFAEHHQWGVGALLVVDGEAVVAARPDEPDPVHASYASDVHPSWHSVGRTATQYWRAPARRHLVARVNARRTYWASRGAIPGGVAFENFELEAPFHPGQKFVFGVTPELPVALGFHPR
jgi:hypothetical protein